MARSLLHSWTWRSQIVEHPSGKIGYTSLNPSRIIYSRPRINIFELGDLVYLCLQPYRQLSLKKSGMEKLKPHFYGPYKVIRQIGKMAYELELSEIVMIHNVFYVSCLKKALE